MTLANRRLSSAHPFLASLRTARRGSAAGPSGITDEHLRTLLNDEAVCTLLHHAAERLARADVPVPVVAAIRAGRIVALRKPNGRVRALVVGDVLRRLVGQSDARSRKSMRRSCKPPARLVCMASAPARGHRSAGPPPPRCH